MADAVQQSEGSGEGTVPAPTNPQETNQDKPAEAAATVAVSPQNDPQSSGDSLAVQPTELASTKIPDEQKDKADAVANVPPAPVTEQQTQDPVAEQKTQEPVAEQKTQEPVAEQKTQEPVTEQKPAEQNGTSAVNEDANETAQNGEWQNREAELLKKIEELQKVANEKGVKTLQFEIKVKDDEIDLLKSRIKNLETSLQAAMSKPGAKNQEMIDKIKEQHEELLTKARGMIFDKTKMVKNQELQIQALTTQVQSLKDINQITKDLLEIRNGEVKAMEDRLEAMEGRFKAEKERYGLIMQRAQTSSSINDDLKKEYDTQLAIFKELREKYEQRVQVLMAENQRLKLSLNGGTSSGQT